MAISSSLTTNQLINALAVLVNNITSPFPNAVSNGIYVNTANQIQFPDNAYNQSLAAMLVLTQDGTNLYIQLDTGDPASGHTGAA